MTTRVRIREVIETLSYSQLVADEIIPDLVSFTPKEAFVTKQYPPWTYQSKMFGSVGILTEMLVRKMLMNLTEVDPGQEPLISRIPDLFENNPEEASCLTAYLANYSDVKQRWSNKMPEVFQIALAQLGDTPTHDFDYEIERSIGFFENIYRMLRRDWPVKTFGKVAYNVELDSQYVEGHPDIISENSVMDVKTTAGYRKMSEQTTLQILGYFALMKGMGMSPIYAGVVLPLQKTVFYFDLSQWTSWPKFLALLNDTAKAMLPAITLESLQDALGNIEGEMAEDMQVTLPGEHDALPGEHECDHKQAPVRVVPNSPLLGWHVPKDRSVYNGISKHGLSVIQDYGHSKPCQMFLRPPRGNIQITFKTEDLDKAKEFIAEYGIRYYTHAPYIINLSREVEDNQWALDCLREDLRLTRYIGGRGVVVHVGKPAKGSGRTVTQGLDNMEASVRYCLADATPDCPLLIETPAGQGTELCTKIEEMADFFSRFTEDELQCLSLTIDTCHVFACGYDPLEYLQSWPIDKLALVHFNDSADPRGSRKDNHASIDQGYIGRKTLEKVLLWCEKRDIPMIIE